MNNQELPKDSILEWEQSHDENDRTQYRARSFWGYDGDNFAYVITKVPLGWRVTGEVDIAQELMAREEPFLTLAEARAACQAQESEQYAEALKEGIVEVNA